MDFIFDRPSINAWAVWLADMVGKILAKGCPPAGPR